MIVLQYSATIMDSVGPTISSLDVLKHIVDVHVHPTDSAIVPQAMEDLAIKICAMSTRKSDQGLVHDLASKYPDKVIPCFGKQSSVPHSYSCMKSSATRLSSLVYPSDSNRPSSVQRGTLSETDVTPKPQCRGS
jgi:hypothetical protein